MSHLARLRTSVLARAAVLARVNASPRRRFSSADLFDRESATIAEEIDRQVLLAQLVREGLLVERRGGYAAPSAKRAPAPPPPRKAVAVEVAAATHVASFPTSIEAAKEEERAAPVVAAVAVPPTAPDPVLASPPGHVVITTPAR